MLLLLLCIPPGWEHMGLDFPYYITSWPQPYLHEFNGLMYKGHVNEAGDFVPRPGSTPMPRRSIRSSGATKHLRAGKPMEPVYEYRSGRLIPGILDKEVFIPDLDGKIVDFKTYRWSPTARRIYNLPGKFITKATYENMKRAGELTAEDLEFNKDR